jgi:hypothetical protein
LTSGVAEGAALDEGLAEGATLGAALAEGGVSAVRGKPA